MFDVEVGMRDQVWDDDALQNEYRLFKDRKTIRLDILTVFKEDVAAG